MKVGEYTHRTKMYTNIIKSSKVKTKDGDETTLDERSSELLAMDIINILEVDKYKKCEIMDKIRETTEFKQYIKSNCGDFYFNYYDRLMNKIEPQYLTRLLYLSCFLDYNNRLVKTIGNKHITISESELQHILKLSRTETYNTKTTLIENDLIRIVDDIIYINPDYCKKGDIIKNKRVEKVRMFEDSMKELYEMATKTEHKKLALLFQILPYINLRWNVVCKDTTEEIMENIHPYTLKELAVILNQTNITRFKKSLLELTVGNEPVIFINENKHGQLLTVNPKVYYKGVDIEELRYLIGLFSIKIN